MVRTGLLIVFYRKKCSHHFGRGKSPLRSGLASLSTQKLPSAISGTNSSFGRGKSPPRSKPKVFRYPLSGMALFFSAAVATLRRSPFSMPATPNIRSFCVFPQSGKCEPSRANKNSKSKRSLRHARNAHQRASCSLRHGPWRCHIKKSRISKFLLTETEFGDIISTCRHNRKAAQLFDSEGTEGRRKERRRDREKQDSFWPTGQEYT